MTHTLTVLGTNCVFDFSIIGAALSQCLQQQNLRVSQKLGSVTTESRTPNTAFGKARARSHLLVKQCPRMKETRAKECSSPPLCCWSILDIQEYLKLALLVHLHIADMLSEFTVHTGRLQIAESIREPSVRQIQNHGYR
ncbi:predicted protein [Histoplasma capsulatum var. duboisii H88]|uniref:Predicted protein n=1 Tax=Ajellomyces capsulatus (strain H88) TaxID=544711 RepID=F0U6B9_AJEC8|nr:predicted protein [Histoplasma capsulatum var. duboisii H88]